MSKFSKLIYVLLSLIVVAIAMIVISYSTRCYWIVSNHWKIVIGSLTVVVKASFHNATVSHPHFDASNAAPSKMYQGSLCASVVL